MNHNETKALVAAAIRQAEALEEIVKLLKGFIGTGR